MYAYTEQGANRWCVTADTTATSHGENGKRKAAINDIPCILEPQGNEKAFRKSWARLIQKIYEVDPLIRPKCQGTMLVISAIDERQVIRAILEHLGIWLVRSRPLPISKSNHLIILSAAPRNTPGMITYCHNASHEKCVMVKPVRIPAIMPVLQVKQPKGERISRKDGCRNVPHKGSSMQHPTFCGQDFLDIQAAFPILFPIESKFLSKNQNLRRSPEGCNTGRERQRHQERQHAGRRRRARHGPEGMAAPRRIPCLLSQAQRQQVPDYSGAVQGAGVSDYRVTLSESF